MVIIMAITEILCFPRQGLNGKQGLYSEVEATKCGLIECVQERRVNYKNWILEQQGNNKGCSSIQFLLRDLH